MASKPFIFPSGGAGSVDPRQFSRYLAVQYRVLESKTKRDLLVEFSHLVVLLDLEHGKPPRGLVALVHDAMKNPESDKLGAAIEELNDYAEGLLKDPTKASNAVADAWKQSKKIREGKALARLDENLVPDRSGSNQISKGQIPIRVQVWSQTEGKMDKPASEIRCAVPRLSMVGNIDKIVRYAATAHFNFPSSSSGKLRLKSENVNLSSKAMLYSASSDIDWVLRDKSTRLGDVVEDAHRLQLVNTKLKRLAVAVVVQYPHTSSEHFIFDMYKPLELVEMLRGVATKPQVLRSIALAGRSIRQTRFLKILLEDVPSPTGSTWSLTDCMSWIGTHPSVTSLGSALSSTESLSSTLSWLESIQDTICEGIEGRSGRSSRASSHDSSDTIKPQRSASDPTTVADAVSLEEELVTRMDNLAAHRGIAEWSAGVGFHQLSSSQSLAPDSDGATPPVDHSQLQTPPPQAHRPRPLNLRRQEIPALQICGALVLQVPTTRTLWMAISKDSSLKCLVIPRIANLRGALLGPTECQWFQRLVQARW